MEKKYGKRKANEEMGFQGYGLRDNPKKSWKSLGFNGGCDDNATTISTLEVECEVCGKQFESMKAMFGHMRHHTAKERKEVNCQECGEKFKSFKALTGHMRLHPLKNIKVKRKRSKRSRCNNSNGLNSSVSSLDESYGFVDIDEDVEEAALCLIMMSKGIRNWCEFISLWESYVDNNDNNDFEIKYFGFRDKFASYASGSMNVFYDKNMSECKELDSGVLFAKEKDDESGFKWHETEIKERISGEMMNLEESELGRDVSNKLISTSLNPEMSDDSQRKNKYKCRICSKTFTSHQALGGHQTIHRKGNAWYVEPELVEDCQKATHVSSSTEIEASCKRVNVENVEDSVDQEMNEVISPETRVCNKVHQCLVCSRVFRSGQALGGHKRSHISRDPEINDKRPAKQLDLSNISDVIDLNLPVMHTDEANGDTGLKLCRLGTDCKNEALLSLVAN